MFMPRDAIEQGFDPRVMLGLGHIQTCHLRGFPVVDDPTASRDLVEPFMEFLIHFTVPDAD